VLHIFKINGFEPIINIFQEEKVNCAGLSEGLTEQPLNKIKTC